MISSHQSERAKNSERIVALSLRWVVALVVVLALTLGISLAAAGSNTLSLDLSVSRFIQDHRFEGSGAITDFGNAIGTAFVGVPVGLALAGLFAWKGWRWA